MRHMYIVSIEYIDEFRQIAARICFDCLYNMYGVMCVCGDESKIIIQLGRRT